MSVLKFAIRMLTIAVASATPAYSVIVEGISGTGNNNGTKTGLDSYLGTTSLSSFTYWDNLVQVGSSSGVYLGRNDSTSRGWVLAAQHVGAPATIAVAGFTYTVNGTRTQIGGSDLTLYEIGGGSDPALPSLPTVALASVAATAGENVLMFGRGFTNSTSGPYSWDGASAGNRWGTNTVEGVQIVNDSNYGPQPYIYTDFDAAGDPGATEFDAQAIRFDSGGGLFLHRASGWELSGIAYFVDDGPDFVEFVATGDGIVDPSQTGDFSAYTDVFSMRSGSGGIDSTTGTLVPEPSSILLSLLGSLCLLRRKR